MDISDKSEQLKLATFLQVKYLKLHFIIEFTEDCRLPVQKASALRGGMGEMLLRVNCIRDRDCDRCEYEPECIVRRIMYSKMRIQPDFMSSGDSVGYVIDCEDYREEFFAGDAISFDMILFGRMSVYFGQILQAFQMLGYYGIGKDHAHFQIVSVTNSKRDHILRDRDVLMSNVIPYSLEEYVLYRKKESVSAGKLVFHTPLSLKHNGDILREFDMEAILKATERRIYQLNCYEGIKTERQIVDGSVPKILSQSHRAFSVRRYSNRHDQKIRLDGICGEMEISGIDESIYELLLAAEIIHIGKNTSFGFGRMSVVEKISK